MVNLWDQFIGNAIKAAQPQTQQRAQLQTQQRTQPRMTGTRPTSSPSPDNTTPKNGWDAFWKGVTTGYGPGPEAQKTVREAQKDPVSKNPYVSSPVWNQGAGSARQENEPQELEKRSGFRIVREVPQAEWNAMSPEQQRAITANWALYQATLADKEIEQKENPAEDYQQAFSSVFGKNVNQQSKSYAPNTVKLLNELGYSSEDVNLDSFLDGSALSSYQDILGREPVGYTSQVRTSVRNALGGADFWTAPELQKSLEAGQSLIQAMRSSGTASSSFLGYIDPIQDYDSMIPADRKERIDKILWGMASKGVYQRIQQEPELKQALHDELDELTSNVDPNVLANYWLKNYEAILGGGEEFMSPQDFERIWIK